MYKYAIGELYHPGRTTWPEASQYNYRRREHELLLFLGAPSPREVDSIRHGDAEFALCVKPPLILFIYRFHPAMPWSDAPYSWHLVPQADRQIPPTLEEGQRALLSVVLVDSLTGIISAMRQLTLSPEFTHGLHEAITEQAAQSWDPVVYDRALNRLYGAASSATLANTAALRCHGGD